MKHDKRTDYKIKKDDSGSLKMKCISGKGTDSHDSMTPIRETPLKKLIIPRPSSTRMVKQLDKRITTPVKGTLKKVDKQRMSNSEECLNSLVMKREKVKKMGKSGKQLKLDTREWNRNENQGLKPAFEIPKRKRSDARICRELLRARKAKELDLMPARRDMLSQGGDNVTEANCSKDVDERVVKRQRVDFDSKQRLCSCNEELSHDVCGVPKENVESVKESNYVRASISTTSDQQELEGEMRKSSQIHIYSDQLVPVGKAQVAGSRLAQKNDISSSVSRVVEICGRRMEKLLQEQQKEVHEFHKTRREEKAKLEEEHQLESALIRPREGEISVRLDKLRMLNHDFKKKMDEHNRHMKKCLKNLDTTQLKSRNEEKQLKANWITWLEETQSRRSISSLGNLPYPESEFRVDEMQPDKLAGGHDDSQNAIPKCVPFSENQNPNGIVQSVPVGVLPSEVPGISTNEATFSSLPVGTVTIPIESDRDNDVMEMMASERATAACIEKHNTVDSSSDCPENGVSILGPSEKQSPDRNVLIMQFGVKPSEVLQTVPNEVVDSDNPMNTIPVAVQSIRVCDGTDAVTLERATVTKAEHHNRAITPISGEFPTSEFSGTTSGGPIAILGNLPLPDSEFRMDRMHPGKLAGIPDDPQNAIPKFMPFSENQNPSGIVQSVPDGVVPSEVHEVSLNEVAFCSLPMGTVTIPIESDREYDGTEVMATATCNKKHNKAGSSIDGPKNVASVSSPLEKHNPDRNVLIIQSGFKRSEVPQTVLNEVVEGDDPMKVVTPAMQSNVECDETDAVSLERATVTKVRQHHREVTSICGESPTLELTGTSSSRRPIALLGNLPLPDSEIRVEMHPSKLSGLQNAVPTRMPLLENPNPNEIVQSMPNGLVPYKVPKISPNEVICCSLPMGTVTIPIESDRENDEMEAMASERATAICIEQNNKASSSNDGTRNGAPVTGPPEKQNPDRNVRILLPSYQLPVSTNPPSAEHNRANVPASIGIQHHQSNGRRASSEQAQVPRQPPIEDLARKFNLSVVHPSTHLPLQPATSMPVGGSEPHVSDLRSTTVVPESVNDHPLRVYPETPQMPQPACLDPLQNEMERIRKDKEQAIKIHEDMKLQLKSECDKEIEEIRKKYDVLLQDAEIALVQKNKDLETCYNKVFVNKLLAEAMTHKHDNAKAAGSPGMQQATISSFMNQLLQLSFQQTAQRPAQRLEQSSASSSITGPLVAPPAQVVNHSSAVLSTSSAGPHISPMIRFRGNLPSGSELRAPAPHLRRFRPSPSVIAPNLPTLSHGMPTQQSPRIPCATSSMPTQLTPRSPTCPSGLYSGIHQPESAGGAGGLPFSHCSVSAFELLMGMDNRTGANLPFQFPHPQDLGSIFHTQDPSELAMTGSMGITTAFSGAATDTICLSDNDRSGK